MVAVPASDSAPRPGPLVRAAAAFALVLGSPGGAAADPPAAGALSAPPGHMAPLPPAVIDDALEVGGEAIDGRKIGTRMTVAVQVNGSGPYRFVVDSGADTSVIGLRAARALQLPPGTPVRLNGMTASGTVDRVLVDQLALGRSVLHHLELPVLQDRDLGGQGMIGIDALVEQRLMLDFERHMIRVEDAQRPGEHLPGEIVVTARRRAGQLILTQVRANTHPVEAVIDTGSEITIGNRALRDRLLGRHPDTLTRIAVTGVTGVTVTLELARVADLRLGAVLLQDVLVAFADVPPFAVFGLDRAPAMLLGTDLMGTFRRVSLDFRSRKVRFQLRRCAVTPTTVSTSPVYTRSFEAATEHGAACRD